MSKAILVAGLAWGDEGKGAAVDYLCREHDAKLVVRYNGGSQAAHNVITADGKHHTFAQFGSGMLIPGVRTYLSRFMLVEPFAMNNEENCLRSLDIADAYGRTAIDSKCLVVTPFDKEINRLKEEMLGEKAHGSCGVGIGETRNYHLTYDDEALFVGDLQNKDVTRLKLTLRLMRAQDTARQWNTYITNEWLMSKEFIKDIVQKYYDWTNTAFVTCWGLNTFGGSPSNIIFEGAQGILLDERKEFMPHNTWTNTTFDNADTLLKETGFTGEVTRVGCIRSYMTRHGAGPFPTEDKKLSELPELHNTDSGFQGAFRRGHFDMKSVKHALDICGGVDEIHMSHIDQLPLIYPGVNVEAYVNNTERLLETPITVLGYGPKAEDRKKRKSGIISRRRSVSDGILEAR